MKNLKGMVVFGSMLLVAVAGYFVAGTYAKYVSTVTQTGTATVAKWSFDDDNTLAGALDLNITPTADTSTLADGKIAPGTSGSFDVAVVNTNTEVGVDLEVTIAETNVPTNLKFYTDNTYTTEFSAENPITGQLTAGDDTGLTKTIYWRWQYETGEAPYTTEDETDTAEGKAATTMNLTLTIKGTQVAPNATPITSHWI